MKNFFLVKTPLQLLNAIEARHYYQLNKEDCILVLMADRKSQAQLNNLADDVNEWELVVDLNTVPLFFSDPLQTENLKLWGCGLFKRSFFYAMRLNRISQKITKANYIFIGHAQYVYMRHFANTLPCSKVVCLDDGNATYLLAEERRCPKNKNNEKNFKKKLKLFLKTKIQKINNNDYKKLEFFTIYNIIAGEGDSVIKHSFSYLRKNITEKNITDEVYFIGSPISETRILSQEEYLFHLKRVVKYFKNRDVVYISHRRESEMNLKEISHKLGIKVVTFDYPLEYQLSIIGPRPKIMASFISSALDSCSLIFGDTMKVISFKLDLKDSPLKDEIDNIYKGYESDKNMAVYIEKNY